MPHTIRDSSFGLDPLGLCQGDRLDKHPRLLRRFTGRGRFTSYDAVTAGNIPRDAISASYYADHPTLSNLGPVRAQCPHARLMPVVVFATHPAPGMLHHYVGWENGIECDCEPTDLTPGETGPWARGVRGQGGDPHIYCNLSSIGEVVASCQAAGLARRDVKVRTAHWTGVPHICSGIVGTVWGTINADSTQYTDSALGHLHGLDASLCEPWWFASQPKPKPSPASGTVVSTLTIDLASGHKTVAPVGTGKGWKGNGRSVSFSGTFDEKTGKWTVK